MPSTKDINLQDDPLKILFVGENGTGKSLALASFYKAGTIRVADFDGRMKPIKSRFPDADIDYDTYGSDNFRAFLDEIEKIQDKTPPWKTWALDSLTSSSACSIVYQLVMKDKMKTTKGGLPATSWDEVNGETVLFTKMLEVMKIVNRKHRTNIIWTAHPIPKTEVVNEVTTRTTSLASYGNKVPALVPGYFDEIYNFQKEKVGVDKYIYMVYTVPKNNLPGKTAMPDLIPNSFDITGKNFYDVLMGFINKK